MLSETEPSYCHHNALPLAPMPQRFRIYSSICVGMRSHCFGRQDANLFNSSGIDRAPICQQLRAKIIKIARLSPYLWTSPSQHLHCTLVIIFLVIHNHLSVSAFLHKLQMSRKCFLSWINKCLSSLVDGLRVLESSDPYLEYQGRLHSQSIKDCTAVGP